MWLLISYCYYHRRRQNSGIFKFYNLFNDYYKNQNVSKTIKSKYIIKPTYYLPI